MMLVKTLQRWSKWRWIAIIDSSHSINDILSIHHQSWDQELNIWWREEIENRKKTWQETDQEWLQIQSTLKHMTAQKWVDDEEDQRDKKTEQNYKNTDEENQSSLKSFQIWRKKKTSEYDNVFWSLIHSCSFHEYAFARYDCFCLTFWAAADN